jgi:NAD-dependent SIR2 family protein deacetylase
VDFDGRITEAAEAICQADALLIAAGAGMGVDSGLPDFRGPEGFWRAYPAFRKASRRFEEMSNPAWFRSDPELAWGFFGHRLSLYRSTRPHVGFEILRGWAHERPLGYFVFTSNVDGHFQKAGFDPDRIVECHGTIHFLQCTRHCTEIWPAEGLVVEVDAATIRATSPLPACPHCGALARPNVLMFGDCEWRSDRSDAQSERYLRWLSSVDGKQVVILEFGAGTSVPTVRHECERRRGQLIRVNPRDAEVPPRAISLPLGALEAIERIDARMRSAG